MKKPMILLAAAVLSTQLTAEQLSFTGKSDKDPLAYHVGETMTFTVTLVDRDAKNAPVKGRKLTWTLATDDGQKEKGTAMSDVPFVKTTSLVKPGFARLTVKVLGEDGKPVRETKGKKKGGREIVFDGGAGADVMKIEQQPLPADFNAFWDREVAKLLAAPCKAKVTELPSVKYPNCYYAQFEIPISGEEYPATGVVAYPRDAKGALPMEVRVTGYGFGASSIDLYHVNRGKGKFVLTIARQGERPREEPSYYKNLETNVLKHYCFRNIDTGKPQDTDYFKMLMRDVKALQWAKTLPAWDGKHIQTDGGSMGGYQSLGLAALDPDVTEVKTFIPWSADFAGATVFKRMSGWMPKWTKSLDYVQLVNLATRVKKANVRMTIGLGDYICPPSGEMILYRSLTCPKQLTVKQNMGHGSEYGVETDTHTYKFLPGEK